jgi:hypothetical protein
MVLLAAAAPAADPADETLVPLEKYTTAKARTLATTYRPQLLQMSERLSRCLPWLDVHTGGIGFRKPRFAQADDRYLSVWVSVDQHDDGAFGALSREARVSAMFSRYGVDLLRRMSRLGDIVADREVEGFAVIVSWLKPGSGRPGGGPPVSETIAFFVDKASAAEFLAGRLASGQFTDRARFSVFEGKEELGRLPLDVGDDGFLEAYRPDGSAPGAGC